MTLTLPPNAAKALSILLWIAILSYAWSIREVFQPITELSLTTLGCLLLLTVIQLGLQTVLLPLMLSCLGAQLPWRTWLPVGILTSTANMLLPAQGGTALRSLYLKKQHNINYSDTVAITSFQLIIRLCCFTLVAAIALAVYLHKQDSDALSLLLITLILALTLPALVWHFQHLLLKRLSHPWLKSLARAFFQLARNQRLLGLSLSINLLILFSNAALFAILFSVFNVPVSMELIMLYTSLKYISLIFNIVPGGMGVSELLSGFLTSLLYGNFEAGVAAALCARGLALLIALSSSSLALFLIKRTIKAS